jgi:hypothetical protein
MSGALVAACVGLFSLAPPADGAGLSVVKVEARQLQRAGLYNEASQHVDRFGAGLDKGPVKVEAERLVARYRALDRAWQRAESDPARHARTFVRVLNAGGRWVPPTVEDSERALRAALKGEPTLSDRIAKGYRLDVDAGSGRGFEESLRSQLASCGVRFAGGTRALRVAPGAKPGHTTVFVQGRAQARAKTGSDGKRAAELVMQALLAELDRGKL